MSEASGASTGAAQSVGTSGEGQAQSAEAAAVQSTQEITDVLTDTAEVDGNKESSTSQQDKAETKPKGATENETPVKEEAEAYEPKHKYIDVLRENYPDREFKSDEEVDEAFDELFNDRNQYFKRGTEVNRKLNEVFNAEPKLRSAISDVINNAVPFQVAMAKYYAPEDFTFEEGDEHYADFEANKKAREENLAKQREKNEAFDKNLKDSITTLEQFMKEEGMDVDTKNEMMTKFDGMMQEMFAGKISQETLRGIQRMVQFDQAVAEAADIAEKKTRNEKITAQMAQEDKPKGDGIPAPAKGGDVKEAVKKPTWIDDIVETANSKDPFHKKLQ